MTLHDREELIALQAAQRHSMDWRVYVASTFCPTCQSRDVAVTIAPFSEKVDELRARRAQMLLMNLALRVLADAAKAARDGDAATPGVRLALRVPAPYVRRQELLVTSWAEVSADEIKPWNGAHQALRWITTRLIDQGYPVWAELR